MKLHIALVTLVLSSVAGVESKQHRLLNASIEKDYGNLRGRRQLKKPAWAGQKGGNPEGSPSLDVTSVPSATSVASESSEDVRRKLPGKGKGKGKGIPAWQSWADSPKGNGGNPDGTSTSSEDHTLEPLESSDDRRKLSGSEASESEDSQASEESVASVSSLDERRVTSATSLASEESEESASSSDERRKLQGKGVEKSGNAWATKGVSGPTSEDDTVSATSGTSAASVSDDERRKLQGKAGLNRGDGSSTESDASESEDSEASGESVASVSSLDERDVPSATSLASESEASASSAE